MAIPFLETPRGIQVCLLKRQDLKFWQFVTGGGENNESPAIAAHREVGEELGSVKGELYPLNTRNSLPVKLFAEHKVKKFLYVIPEFCFAFRCQTVDIALSEEHSQYQWTDIATASHTLKFDGDRTALWELEQRLIINDL